MWHMLFELRHMKDVNGKVAFITGGGSGVGFGMAKVFHDAGMKIVIADIRQDHLDRTMAYFDETGRKAHPIRLDVTDREAFNRAADEVERLFGKVHVVCNNAGVNFFAPMDECTYDDWDWLLSVNLGGVITGPGAGVYTTSKFAVRGLSESLRWSLAPHRIGVSVLCPALVKSEIYESDMTRPQRFSSDIGPANQEFMARLPEIHQFGMEPEEVGEKVLRGIRRNDLYIFTHPEFKEELKELFDEILAALPEEGEADPRRLAFEEMRRQANARAKASHIDLE